jgi:hypothetical protein
MVGRDVFHRGNVACSRVAATHYMTGKSVIGIPITGYVDFFALMGGG